MQPTKPNGSSSSSAARYKVLVVDDDASVLRSMAAVLELELEVTPCSSAERALALLKTGDFHVVCSDYSMDGMTGVELLEKVAELPEPVGCLLVTGSSSFIGRHGAGVGDHYVLMKPVDPERLSKLILQLARTAEMKRNAKKGR
jgi:DNA-binding NtrC family response regulator